MLFAVKLKNANRLTQAIIRVRVVEKAGLF